MIDLNTAYKKFRKKYPKLTITEAASFDEKYWIFVAVEDPRKSDYNDPFYIVDKNTGAISFFNPIDELDKFEEAFLERPVQLPR